MITFSPNCSFPRDIPSGFVKDPEIRSTMDIVWSCTSIIILSTWSVLHLTVPPDLKPQSKRQQFRKQIYLLSRKLVWMGIMLAFPEYLVELAREDGVPWSLAHTVLANIGGIAVRNLGTRVPEFLIKFQKSQAKYLRGLGVIPWKPFQPHIALASTARTDTHEVLGSKEYYKRKHIAPLHGNIWVLDSKQLALARGHGIISRLPHLEENEIKDRSKSDGLVRLFALMQVLWLLVQLIVRSVEGIPFAALEPQDAGVPFYIGTDAVVTPEAFAQIAEAAPISFLQTRHYYIPQSVIHQVFEDRYQKKHVDRMMILMNRWSKWSVTVLGPLYLSARIFIMVESYRSLYYLPAEAFISTWAANVPHQKYMLRLMEVDFYGKLVGKWK
ncbi:hypothetical protein BDW60DRAFT_225197 [Aspergillus nidulans var. acristatus]